MKTISKYILAGLVLSAAVGCKERMIELNSDPGSVSSTKPEYIFSSATGGMDMGRGVIMNKYSGPMLLMQYVATYDGGGDPFVDPELPGGKEPNHYGDYYRQYFVDGQGNRKQSLIRFIDEMDAPDRERYADVRAMTQIVMAYEQWRLVEAYGAIVYKEAFNAIESGITKPKYDLGQDIYKDIDATLKEAITVLSAEVHPNAGTLGLNDYFYGYYNVKGTVKTTVDHKVQRANWLRFANMIRLQMAWKLKKVDAQHFETVKTEVLAVPNGIMTKIEEGCYHNMAYDNDDNPDDVDIVSQGYAISHSFLSVLKSTNDPRLQYFARPNGVSSRISFNYRVIKQLFPDSIAKYGEILRDGNIFQGHVTNPRFKGKSIVPVGQETAENPNFIGSMLKTFVLPNTNYPDSLCYVDPSGKKIKVCGENTKEFSMSIQIASPAQGRYFVKGGGKKNANQSISDCVTILRQDGPGFWDAEQNASLIPMRRPLFTYTHQCFMFAHLGITAGGKSPLDWFKEGVKTAMVELRDDAIRFKIQVAMGNNYPIFPGYNDNGNYAYTDDQIDAYLTSVLNAPGFNLEEEAINQAWIYCYQTPEISYSWWKTTGYPKIVVNAKPAEAAVRTKPFLEQPYKNAAALQELVYPRRGCLPDRATVNKENWYEIKELLPKQPGFGDWPHTNGRIWFDVE